jgi:predicted ArsR family transcriptional regulator
MSSNEALAKRPISQRVVLLGLAHHARTDAEPAHTGEVVRACTGRIHGEEIDALGRVGEAEVSRALNRLEAEGLVEMEPSTEPSPVGKGRPAYSLAVDVEAVVAFASDDDAIAPLLERFAADWD